MISITFKNVDQGDSIIIQWTKSDKTKGIGVIDCNLNSKYENPVLTHLKILDPDKLDFLILTHPHEDHYSGFIELFDFIEKNKLSCSYFIYSCANIRDILTAPSAIQNIPKFEFNNLVKLYSRSYDLYKKEIITNYHSISATDYTRIDIDKLKIEFYSPSQIEVHSFNKAEHKINSKLEKSRNSNYNYLATFIKLTYEDKAILLTSDIKSSSFKRIIRKTANKSLFDNLVLIQIPHHGGTSSFYKPFWESIQYKNIPAVVSVGNNIYKHPNEEFINSLKKMGFRIHSTNQIGCLNELKSTISQSTNDFFDLFEDFKIIDNEKLCGDQVFKFNS